MEVNTFVSDICIGEKAKPSARVMSGLTSEFSERGAKSLSDRPLVALLYSKWKMKYHFHGWIFLLMPGIRGIKKIRIIWIHGISWTLHSHEGQVISLHPDLSELLFKCA